MSVPLFFAILPAIILAGIPDYKSDIRFSKKTLAVLVGPRGAAITSIFLVLIAAGCGILLWHLRLISGAIGAIIFVTVPHAAILGVQIYEFIKAGDYDRKINKIMATALIYILWLGVIPLLNLTFD